MTAGKAPGETKAPPAYVPPEVFVSVESGEDLARAVHRAAIELGPAHGYTTEPIAFDDLPGRQVDFVLATFDLALRRLAMSAEARRGGAGGGGQVIKRPAAR